MSSLMPLPGQRWRLQFVNSSGKPKSIRPGRMTERNAGKFQSHFDDLLAATLAGELPKPTTAAWLGTLSDALHRKLVKYGLATARKPAGEGCTPTGPTIRAFLDGYLAGRTDVKPLTLRAARQDADSLCEYLDTLTAPPSLAEFNRGTAKDFMVWLKAEGYSEATIARRVIRCREFFTDAIDRDLIGKNPFAKIKGGSQANAKRFYFVTRDETTKLLDAAGNLEWRLIIALARYGGFRTPSETLTLAWGDIDWERERITVHAPKTGTRIIPMFPELRPLLEEAFEQADEGSVHVISRHRDVEGNLRTQLLRIIKRAGLTPWERVFHNMRASRQNELAAEYPIHVAARWIGNSALIANKHYLSDTEDYFATATGKTYAKSYVAPNGTTRTGRTDAKSYVHDSLTRPQILELQQVAKAILYPRQDSNL